VSDFQLILGCYLNLDIPGSGVVGRGMFFSALAARVCGPEGSGFYIFESSNLFALSWCDDQLEILLPHFASLRGANACHFFAGGGGAAF